MLGEHWYDAGAELSYCGVTNDIDIDIDTDIDKVRYMVIDQALHNGVRRREIVLYLVFNITDIDIDTEI